MIELLLIFGYTFLLCWWISKSRLFAAEGLSKRFVIFVFILKVAFGITYGWIYSTILWGDTDDYIKSACYVYETFPKYPEYYLKHFVGINEPPPPDYVYTYTSGIEYFKSLGGYTLIHIHALIRIFSFGYYNVHVIFMALISLVAGLNIYKVFQHAGGISPRVLAAGVFFVPSLLFWTAGIHKDGLVYFGVSLFLLGLYRRLNPRGNTLWKDRIYLLVGALITLIFRPYVLFIIIPAVVAYVWAMRSPKQPTLKFLTTYGVAGLSAYLASHGSPAYNPLLILVSKHNEFLVEFGLSDFDVPRLSLSWASLLGYLPTGFANAIMRPLMPDCKHILHYLASFEMMIFAVMVMVAAFHFKRVKLDPIYLFILFYSLANLLFIGILLSNSGTIARYRAVSLGFLVIVVLARTDFSMLRRKLLRLWVRMKGS